MVANLNGNSDNANNRKVHFDDNSVNKSNDVTGSEIANSLRELGISFSIPINRESSMNSFSIRASNILSITQASKITKEVSRIKSIQRQQVEQTENTDIQINRISEIRLSYMKAVHPYNTNKNLPELYGLGECDRDSSISRHTLAEIKNKDNDFVISDRFTQTIRESFNKINENSTIVDQQPYIPTMFHLLYFWIFMSILALLMEYSSSNIKKSNVLYFQISSTISVFIGSILFRLYLLSLHVHWLIMSTLQSVAIFLPTVIFIVIFTSNESYLNWENSLTQYKTSLSIIYFNYWGAGDIIAMLLPAAISSLAFSTVDAICQYYKLLPLIIPAVWISIIIIIIQGGILAYLLQSPTVTALTLLTRTITTPVAVEISELTGASSSITAASTIISAMISYLYAPYFLNKMNITNPIARGVGAAVSGTLLGVLSMDENGEDIAAGVGMAGYGIATILYASMMAIEGFRNFVVGIATS